MKIQLPKNPHDIIEETTEPEPVAITAQDIITYLDYLHTSAHTMEDAKPFDEDVMERIKNELYHTAQTYGEIPSIDEQMDALDWSRRHVMVGTVRSKEQLDYCLKEKCYYVPDRFVPVTLDGEFVYIALHEEGLDGEPCIRYYGKLASACQVRRKEIDVPMSRDNGDELYLMIHIKEWLTLDHPIPIHDSYKGRPRYTNLFLLQHCNRSYQLFSIRSAEDYRMCATLIKAYNHRYEAANLHIIGGRLILRTEGEDFVVMNPSGRIIDRFSVSLYETHPASVVFRLADLLK